MEGIKVSIIVPVYNVEQYLKACMESILSQTLKEIEIILVDDGSTDKSGEICDFFKKQDERVKVIHKENGGLSSARNTGIYVASGEYIGFVDSDDLIKNTMYEKLYYNAKQAEAQIAACCHETFFEKIKETARAGKKDVWNREEAIKFFFLRKLSESVCDKIFERKLWTDMFFPENEINEDTITLCSLLTRSEKVVFIDSIQYFYRNRKGSITKSGYSEKFRIVDRHLETISDQIREEFPSLLPYMKYFFSVHYYCLLLAILKDSDNEKYREDYNKYLRKFSGFFWWFMYWGTGKQKDRIMAILLKCRCGRLISMLSGR